MENNTAAAGEDLRGIPYHFTCNYCGGTNTKRVMYGGARATAYNEKMTGICGRTLKRKVNVYRRHLLAGTLGERKRLLRIPLESTCVCCGKAQVWNPDFSGKEYGGGRLTYVGVCALLTFAVSFFGALISGINFLGATSHGKDPSPLPFFFFLALLAACTLFCALWRAMDLKLEKDYYDENYKDEPNAERNLPELDI